MCFSSTDWNGAQHDSRSLLGTYYRYSPRDINRICTGSPRKWIIDEPKIHRSVFERIAGNVIPYAPTGIPETYKVVSTRKEPPSYETNDEKKERLRKMNRALRVIMNRVRLYYVFVIISIISIILMVSPVIKKFFFPWEVNHWFHTRLFKGLSVILPNMAEPWLTAWKQSPLLFYPAVIFFLFFLLVKMVWNTKTQAYAAEAWHFLKTKNR